MVRIHKIMAGIIVMLLLFSADTLKAKNITGNQSNGAEIAGAGIYDSISMPEYRYVWEEGMETSFNLTPLNSDIFYYDIDSGTGGEFMNIDIGDTAERSIDVDKLIYKTSASFSFTSSI